MALECPHCQAQVPPGGRFCQVCGYDLQTFDATRRKSFAVKPDERVASFALISTIMPHGVGRRPQTYRIALTIALVVALLAAIFGALPIALLVAAFAIPVVYIVYLYDVNLWQDEPLPVTGAAFGLTAVLAAGFTVFWIWLRGNPIDPGSLDGTLQARPQLAMFVLVAIVVPVVGEALRQIGPLILASRPAFDDLMDGLTFGVVSGVAYASLDTLIKHWDLITGGFAGHADPGFWASLIFLEGFIKPLIMGTATGIACAEFSGLGRGYDGFTPRYFRGLAEAIMANIAYQAGGYLFSFVDNPTLGVVLNLLWGLLILAVLILRVRTVLHSGLLEAALDRFAREGSAGPGELEFCAYCEMPLLAGAAFCNACGTAVRVAPKLLSKAGSASSGPPIRPADPPSGQQEQG